MGTRRRRVESKAMLPDRLFHVGAEGSARRRGGATGMILRPSTSEQPFRMPGLLANALLKSL